MNRIRDIRDGDQNTYRIKSSLGEKFFPYMYTTGERQPSYRKAHH